MGLKNVAPAARALGALFAGERGRDFNVGTLLLAEALMMFREKTLAEAKGPKRT